MNQNVLFIYSVVLYVVHISMSNNINMSDGRNEQPIRCDSYTA